MPQDTPKGCLKPPQGLPETTPKGCLRPPPKKIPPKKKPPHRAPLDNAAKLRKNKNLHMTIAASVPVGRLNSVERNWDYRPGWVRAPLREIVFNDRLTKQARLLWLWLASVPINSRHISWGECETMLRCGTKARRSCMCQLVTEGYISVQDDGIVVMHDPYEVFNNKRNEILNEIREEWKDEVDYIQELESIPKAYDMISLEKDIDKELEKIKQPVETEEAVVPVSNKSAKTPKVDTIPMAIIQAWNRCKPDSYSSMRSLSTKQKECITKHMKNLGLTSAETESFICAVCTGLTKSKFWSKQVDQKGRNFNSVFGYGNPQDIKMRNIENLYQSGLEEKHEEQIKEDPVYTVDQQDTIDAYRFVSLNLEQSTLRGDTKEVERWTGIMKTTLEELKAYNVNVEDI